MLNQIEIKPAMPGRYAERVSVGPSNDWTSVIVQSQNSEGEVIEVRLTSEQALNLAGHIQGSAFCVRPKNAMA